uniref:Col_cuticle_N domain-containing protein n=1 Tax=Strongyloides stercoralis TaxID=6248 RepID=A0A0K0ESY9_STRER
MDNVAKSDQCFFDLRPNSTNWEEKMDTSDSNMKANAITIVNIPPEYRYTRNFDREIHYRLPKWLQTNIEYNREEVAHFCNYFPQFNLNLFNDIPKIFSKDNSKEEDNLKSENEDFNIGNRK